MHQHVRRFDADANNAGEQSDHRMRFFLRSLFQPLRTRLLNCLDLVHDKAQSRHVSTKFEKRVWRERNPLRLRTKDGLELRQERLVSLEARRLLAVDRRAEIKERLSAYQAAKWAVGGFTEVLAQEVGHLGIKVTALEPGGMMTNWANRAASEIAPIATWPTCAPPPMMMTRFP